MPTAAIYVRVSSDEQVSGTSLGTQEASCRAWCDQHGYTVVRVFQDAGECAKTSDRAAFLELLAWAGTQKPDVVVVWKFDRWARNATDSALAERELARHGTRLVSVTEPTSDDPAGRLLRTFLAGIAQFDNEVRAQRSQQAMRAVAAAGGWYSLPPYGYRLERRGTLPILVQVPDRSAFVRELFAGLADGRRSLAQTVALAGEHGIRPNAARKMLRNPVYAGFLRGKLTDLREVAAAFPGIVERGVWDAAQDVLDGRRRTQVHQAVRDEWPLRGLLACSVCGRPLTACHVTGHGGRYGYYQCKAGHVRIRAERLHEAWTMFLAQTGTAVLPIVEQLKRELRALASQRIDAAERVERDAVERTERLRARRKRLLDAYLDGAIANDEFVARDRELGAALSAALPVRNAGQDWLTTVEDAVSACARLIARPADLWATFSTADRRRFVQGLFGDGLSLTPDGSVQTSREAGIIGTLQASAIPDAPMAPPRGVEPLFPG